jgi:hypothetical protein
VAVFGKRPGRRHHEQDGVGIDDRLLHEQRAGAEHVTHQHQGELHQHHEQRQPGGRLADAAIYPFDPPADSDQP